MDSAQAKAWDDLVEELTGPRYAYTLELARAYAEKYPDSAPGCYAYAKALCGVGRFAEARNFLLKGLSRPVPVKPSFACSQCGHFRRAMGDFVRASRWYKRAARFSAHGRYVADLGLVLAERGLFDEAERTLRAAIDNSEEPLDELCRNLALVLRAKGDYSVALECVEQTLEVNPANHAAQEIRSDLLLVTAASRTPIDRLRSNDERSGSLGQRATSADEVEEAAWEQLIREMGGPNAAYSLELAKEYTAAYPDEPGWYILAEAFGRMARYDDARAALLEGQARFPGWHRHFVLACAEFREAMGDYQRASRWYRRAARRWGHREELWIFLGASLVKQGHLDEAEACFRTGIENSDELLDEAYHNLGFVLSAKRQYREALEAFDRALEETPSYEPAQRARDDVALAMAICRGI